MDKKRALVNCILNIVRIGNSGNFRAKIGGKYTELFEKEIKISEMNFQSVN